ncbi:hypothetical protein KUCAC02_006045 [Chaenocephalus aceratus]|uniref:Uncharacterized protein n=1 Tax=Chaenocephalus aceratus TaxID=36190 RepID=A0ACB9WQ43_CHAAC|nr:hypothetical protein KUCAC02_006045 [Chaenocephalus aceratus]
MPHMEDEVEYYSHYDTLMEETAVTFMDKEQSSPITQENSGFGGEPHTEGTSERDFHMEDQCVSESQEVDLSLNVSSLNPEVPAFQPNVVKVEENWEEIQIQHSPHHQILGTEESLPHIPVNLNELCSPNTTESGIQTENGEENAQPESNVPSHEEETVLRRSSRKKSS